MHKNWEKGVTLYLGHIVTQVIEKPTSPGYEIARGVSFQEFLVKVSMAKGKNKMETKKQHEKSVNYYRMPSTGSYINLFVHTAKTNLLTFQIVISYSSQDFPFICKIHTNREYRRER